MKLKHLKELSVYRYRPRVSRSFDFFASRLVNITGVLETDLIGGKMGVRTLVNMRLTQSTRST